MTEKTKSGPSPRKRAAASKSLAVAGTQETWTRLQVNALRRLGFDAPVRDLDLLFHVAKTSGLDPFRGHLYMARNGRGEWEVRTTIHGLLTGARAAAQRAGDLLAISAPEWADRDGTWTDVWVGPGQPAAARISVHRAGQPFTATALFAESAVIDPETMQLNRTWSRRGASQLAKVAKAAALRDACPTELAGLYTDVERYPGVTVAGAVVVSSVEQTSQLDDLLAEDD